MHSVSGKAGFVCLLDLACLALAGLLAVACAPVGKSATGATPIAAPIRLTDFPAGSTWVAYEVAPQGLSLIPSYCAAPPGLFYHAPATSLGNLSLCQFGRQFSDGRLNDILPAPEKQGFNPPGAAGRLSSGRHFTVRDRSVPPRVFNVFEVAPGHYFPALLGFDNRLAKLDGLTPYYEVKQGQINYLGSYHVPIGADFVWQPDALQQALLQDDPSFDLARLNVMVPARAKIICNPPTGYILTSVSCFVERLEGLFF